jgi:hypothetical protein
MLMRTFVHLTIEIAIIAVALMLALPFLLALSSPSPLHRWMQRVFAYQRPAVRDFVLLFAHNAKQTVSGGLKQNSHPSLSSPNSLERL